MSVNIEQGELVMNYLVVYSSKSGNTKKLAEAIYDFLPDGKELKSIAEAPDPTGYIFVAVGFWVKNGQPDPTTAEYLKKFNEDHQLFLFATHGGALERKEVDLAMQKAKKLARKARIVGQFSCLGEVGPEIPAEAHLQASSPESIAAVESAAGHPDQADIDNVLHLLEALDLPW